MVYLVAKSKNLDFRKELVIDHIDDSDGLKMEG